jgi:hypothetical protein
MIFNSTNILFQSIIDCAALLNLPDVDLMAAKEYLKYNEWELCLDQIATQLYEYNIEVTPSFVQLIDIAVEKIQLPAETHSYLKELINNDSRMPNSVTSQIDTILKKYWK